MLKKIKGSNMIYEVDTTRRIVYEYVTDALSKEDIKKHQNIYETEISSLLNIGKGKENKPWAKVCHMKDYTIKEDIAKEVNDHAVWGLSNSYTSCAMIEAGAVVKLQMKRSIKDVPGFTLEFFEDEAAAKSWLNTKGF